MKPTIIAVDGPAGSGKSTVCAAVCAALGWNYVNTGALYRAVGYLLAKSDKIDADEQQLRSAMDEICRQLTWNPEKGRLSFRQEDITDHLNSDQAGKAASRVAKNAIIRESLLPLQRRFALTSVKGAVVDGRDIGTVVFPDADLKIFLTASLEQRALRRQKQLNDDCSLDQLKSGLAERDTQDETRSQAPLKKAEDAVTLDTTDLTQQQVINHLIALIKDLAI